MSEQTEREVLPGYYKCISSSNPLFAAGVVYEVAEHSEVGPIIATEHDCRCVPMPRDARFVPHDPWADYKRQQAALAREGE